MRDGDDLVRLSGRELEVLLLIAKGCSNRRIAEELNLSLRTVKFHAGNIFSKLGVHSRSQAIVWAWASGMARPAAEAA
jgi:ATP/maltotriose-dependent transcriptional regulator MalT